jgi:dTDP-4-amino-4,6-dideoxygalactose transaminase
MINITNKDQRREILASRYPKVRINDEAELGGVYKEEEVEAALKAIRSSMDWRHGGFGFVGAKEIQDFERAFAEYTGAEYAISINGAGSGLDMAMMCLDLEPGDEVICPAVNFFASAYSIYSQGGKLVVCDIEAKTFNLDPGDVERRITPRTRAIFPVHFIGVSAPMDDLLDIAERHPHPKHGPLKVIDDAARACGGTYRGTRVGKKGWMTVFSLHTRKHMTTLGEGGMITTDDPELNARLCDIRQFGSTTDSWGTNYKMTKVQAAVGSVQLSRLDETNAMRVKRARERSEILKEVGELTLPCEPPDCGHVYYVYPMLVPRDWAGEKRNRLMKILDEDYRVGSWMGSAELYKTRCFYRELIGEQVLPVSDEISERIVCTMIHALLTEEENEYIAAAIADAVERVAQGE